MPGVDAIARNSIRRYRKLHLRCRKYHIHSRFSRGKEVTEKIFDFNAAWNMSNIRDTKEKLLSFVGSLCGLNFISLFFLFSFPASLLFFSHVRTDTHGKQFSIPLILYRIS